MAIKSGLDFFPLDVCLDKKFELIEAEYGLTGFGVIVHLLQEARRVITLNGQRRLRFCSPEGAGWVGASFPK